MRASMAAVSRCRPPLLTKTIGWKSSSVHSTSGCVSHDPASVQQQQQQQQQPRGRQRCFSTFSSTHPGSDRNNNDNSTEGSLRRYIINLNPATGQEILPRIACTTEPGAMDRVVETAVAASASWRATPLETRIAQLRQGIQQALRDQRETLCHTMVQEMGKPLREAQMELDAAIKGDAYWELLQDVLQPSSRSQHTSVVREPFGVVAICSPWNFPCDELLLWALPALASGNTVIIKPSEHTPLTGSLTVQALQSALLFPDGGVLQLVQGHGSSVGAALVDHPHVDLVAMTGSTATGQWMRQRAAMASNNGKRVLLEMGGKDAMLVFANADGDDDDIHVQQAARDAVQYSIANAGQVCCAVERVFVQEPIYAAFVERVVSIAAAAAVQEPVGPLVSARQLRTVQSQVDDAIHKGARLVYSDNSSRRPKGGFFFPVTVLADVTPDMEIYRQETFGPVVCLSKFADETEAIAMANNSEFGLMASVYTSDAVVQGQRVAEQLRVGQVGINGSALDHMDVTCPWVGHKQSGYGFHSGREGFQSFSLPKTIVTVDAT